jgi:hypothetical protein
MKFSAKEAVLTKVGLCGVLLLLVAFTVAQGGSGPITPAQWSSFPQEQALQSHMDQIPGCNCAKDHIGYSDIPASFASLQVSPTSILTRVGDEVQVRYDGSYICSGQTDLYLDNRPVDAKSGVAAQVMWEQTLVQSMPDTYGFVTYGTHVVNGQTVTGYQQPGAYQINLSVIVKCYDDHAIPANCVSNDFPRKQCTLTSSIPVTVQARSATPIPKGFKNK